MCVLYFRSPVIRELRLGDLLTNPGYQLMLIFELLLIDCIYDQGQLLERKLCKVEHLWLDHIVLKKVDRLTMLLFYRAASPSAGYHQLDLNR